MLNKKSVRNIVNQMFSQFIIVVIPIISIPIILQKMSLEQYGSVVIYQSIYLTMTAVVEYGFNLTGPKYLNEANDKSDMIYQIIIAKSILFIPTSLIFIVFALLYGLDFLASLVVMSSVFLSCLNVNYYYQYVQSGSKILQYDGVAKIIGLVFICIGAYLDTIDVVYVLVSQLFIFSFVNIIKLRHLKKNNVLKWPKSYGLRTSLYILNEGKGLFYGKLASIGYSHSSILYLSFFFSTELVAVFSLIDKVVKSAQNFVWPFIYDNNAKILKNKISKLRAFLYTSLVALLICLAIILCSEQISIFLKFGESKIYINSLKTYTVLIVIITMGASISYYYNIPDGNFNNIRNSAWIALISFVLLGVLFSGKNEVIWLCMVVILSESVSLLYKAFSLLCRKQKY